MRRIDMENKHAALYEYLVKQADRITDEWLSRTASEKEKRHSNTRTLYWLFQRYLPKMNRRYAGIKLPGAPRKLPTTGLSAKFRLPKA